MRAFLLVVTALAACASDIPETVYVPAPDYQQHLAIAIVLGDETAPRTGIHLRLSAMREMGPWRAVPRDSANLEACWWGGPPPEREPEVAANVHWHVQPSDSVLFNIPMPPDSTRTIRFARPGVYRLWAESHGCPRSLFSDTLTFTVQ